MYVLKVLALVILQGNFGTEQW